MEFSHALVLLKANVPVANFKLGVFLRIRKGNIIWKGSLNGEPGHPVDSVTSSEILDNTWEPIREVDFESVIMKGIKDLPKDWRDGQKVFNYVDSHFGSIAREVGNDCFYDDYKIDDFINECYKCIFDGND